MGLVGIRIMSLSRALTSYQVCTEEFLESLAILTSLFKSPEANDTLLPSWGSCPMPRGVGDASNLDTLLWPLAQGLRTGLDGSRNHLQQVFPGPLMLLAAFSTSHAHFTHF